LNVHIIDMKQTLYFIGLILAISIQCIFLLCEWGIMLLIKVIKLTMVNNKK